MYHQSPLGADEDPALARAVDRADKVEGLSAGDGWFDLSGPDGKGYAIYYDRGRHYVVTTGAGSDEREIGSVDSAREAVQLIAKQNQGPEPVTVEVRGEEMDVYLNGDAAKVDNPNGGEYTLALNTQAIFCSCPAFEFHCDEGESCKHMTAAKRAAGEV